MCNMRGIWNDEVAEFPKKLFNRPSIFRQLFIKYFPYGPSIYLRENGSVREINFIVGQEFSQKKTCPTVSFRIE
jgi:hypothetical protein